MKKLMRILGSVYLAVILITLAALSAIAGTILEAQTDSHLYAEQLIYKHPFFILLLALFFVNILVSALNRYPFKQKHIPFLITHLALLMIISGVMTKQLYGTQGSIILLEGSETDHILIPNSYAIQVRDRQNNITQIPIKKNWRGEHYISSNVLKLEHFAEHSSEEQESWIKGDYAFIYGLPPQKLKDDDTPSAQLKIYSSPWDLYTLKTDDLEKTIEKLYLQNLTLTPKDQLSLSLKDSTLHLSSGSEKAKIPLTGDEALTVINTTSSHIGSFPFQLSLKQSPAILLIRDENQKAHLIGFDADGRIFRAPDEAESLFIYDRGFAGYSRQVTIPQPKQSLEAKQEILLAFLKDELSKNHDALSPPLQLLYKTCQRTNMPFAESCIDFLTQWDRQHGWFADASLPFFDQMEWIGIHKEAKKSAFWAIDVLKRLDHNTLLHGDLHKAFKSLHWPLAKELLAEKDPHQLLTKFTQQLFMVSDQLPEPTSSKSNAELFSAYLRAYDIHLATITPPGFNPLPPEQELATLEFPLSLHHTFLPPPTKLEEAIPAIVISSGDEKLSLGYDRQLTKLAWPLGNNLLRFSPMTKTIPHQIRIREAREVHDSSQTQATGYECALLINNDIEKTISMNNVYETWDGYRFYLSSISPKDETAVKQVQIVVNHDPAKYFLTYPGGLLLALGIFLLFWWRPYASKNK